jgi:hypothetical protein
MDHIEQQPEQSAAGTSVHRSIAVLICRCQRALTICLLVTAGEGGQVVRYQPADMSAIALWRAAFRDSGTGGSGTQVPVTRERPAEPWQAPFDLDAVVGIP